MAILSLTNLYGRFLRHKWLILSHCVRGLLWLILVMRNFEPGTRLLGWDLMDSSFNPGLNLQRSLLSVWQSFQGLGIIGGHGYVAQFPHALFLFLLNFIFPQSLLRYAFADIMLLSGVFGCFWLVRDLLRRNRITSEITINLSSLTASVVYLLHLATVQTFYVHLEPFIVMYGIFPWVVLVLFKVFEKPKASSFLLFFLLNIALSVIGFIPPVFLTYVFFLIIFSLTACLVHSMPMKEKIVRLTAIWFLIIAANLYWLVSVASFTVLQQQDYLDSKLNQLTTGETILKNQLYGSVSDAIQLKSFYFESLDQNRFGSSQLVEPIFEPWIKHLNSPVISVIGVLFFLLSITGVFLALRQLVIKRELHQVWAVWWIVSFAAIATGIPVLSFFSAGLRAIPVFNQAFRIPFTKLSMSMSLFLAIGVGIVIGYFLELLRKKITRNSLRSSLNFSVSSLLILLAVIYSFPSFQGNFLYKGARVKVPPDYQEAFQFFSNHSSHQRVANFPILTNSGWEMFKWSGDRGYTGSGFYWYGMSQPMLNRAFDVWSPSNETYRNQMSTALYAKNIDHIKQIAQQYDIAYFLIDESVIIPDFPNAPLFNNEL